MSSRCKNKLIVKFLLNPFIFYRIYAIIFAIYYK